MRNHPRNTNSNYARGPSLWAIVLLFVAVTCFTVLVRSPLAAGAVPGSFMPPPPQPPMMSARAQLHRL